MNQRKATMQMWDGAKYCAHPALPMVPAEARSKIPFILPSWHWGLEAFGTKLQYAKVRIITKGRFFRRKTDLILIRVNGQIAALPVNPRLKTESQIKLHLKEVLDA